MAIIAVFGYAGSGKDTVGSLIQYVLSGNYDVPINEMIENYKNKL